MATSLNPPEERIWWRTPVHRIELVWILVALLWCLFMFGMMIYWHAAGGQNLSNESYRISAERFSAKAQAMIDKYQVGEEAGYPIVHPPPDSEVYLIARLWQWWPILEFEKDKSYRLHISSLDWQHGFSLQPVNLNLQIHPDYEMVVTISPDKAGEYTIMCNEFCGVGHHNMVGKIYVK